MSRLNTIMFIGASVAASLSLAVWVLSAPDRHEAGDQGRAVTVIGELVDICFITSDGEARGAEHAKCVAECLRSGLPAGILPADSREPDEMLYLLTNPTALAPCAGKTIKVEGMQYDHKHAIDVSKLWVQDVDGWTAVQLTPQPEKHARSAAPKAGASELVNNNNPDQWQAPTRASQRQNPVASDARSLEIGTEVYASECVSCHGSAGHGDGPLSQNLARRPPDFASARASKQSDGALFWKITEGHRPMPTWRTALSETDRWNVVNYIRSMMHHAPSDVQPSATQPAK